LNCESLLWGTKENKKLTPERKDGKRGQRTPLSKSLLFTESKKKKQGGERGTYKRGSGSVLNENAGTDRRRVEGTKKGRPRGN